MKLNRKYLFLSAALLLIEAAIALFLRDSVIRAHAGGILVVVPLYCLMKSFVRLKTKLLPFYIFIFAVCVEILQLH